MNIEYNVISSSSDGNALILNKFCMIDCGVPFVKIKPYLKNIKVILLSHIHSDHLCKATVKKIAFEKPTMKWVCGEWLVETLVELKVPKQNIYVVESKKTYDLGAIKITPIETVHDVRNMSYKVDFKPGTIYYATDTSKLEYLDCLRGLDYYFVENNYSSEELEQRIKEKEDRGEFAYEYRVKETHLSAEEVNSFLIEMMQSNSQFVYCHQHKERKEENDKTN